MKQTIIHFSIFFLFVFISAINNQKLFAQENCGNGIDDDSDGLIDCLDPDCTANPPSTFNFNTGNNGMGGALPGGSQDLLWTFSTTFAGPYAPAIIMSPTPPNYYSSPWPNAAWISLSQSGNHSGQVDWYFKINFLLPCANLCGISYSNPGSFCLNFDYFADNSIYEIWVNGVPQSSMIGNIPVASPYTNQGYNSVGMLSASLCQNWQPGLNELIVRVASGAPYIGLLVQSSINYPPTPTATVNGTTEVCQGDPPPNITFTGNGTPPFTFTYNINGGTNQAVSTTSGNTATVSVPTNTPGVYTYTLANFSDSNSSCFGITDTAIVTVHSNPNVFITPDSAYICPNDTISLTANSSTVSQHYLWSTADTTQSVNVNPGSVSTYTVSITDVNGCSGSSGTTVFVNQYVLPVFNASGPYCAGDTAGALPDTSVNGITGTWSPASVSTVSAGTSTYTFTPASGQCADTATMDVTVNIIVTPELNALGGPYCVGDIPPALPSTSVNGITGTWSPAAISTASPGTSLYTFTPDAGQCAFAIFVDSVFVKGCEVTIPNIFTPNNDGSNDTFVIKGIEDFPESLLEIYNRWGKKLYECVGYKNDWTGKNYADGVYYYILTLENGKSHHGTVTLMR